ncbi:zinc finger protein 33A-like [Daphnia carinata]|uniref:zinc finger protein 33A-like n=1 Tax=Daphnia carinata TaxID=120202 RepID=UPI0028694655|nr:zinc finger protein 33A-like [Daphnia carinata]
MKGLIVVYVMADSPRNEDKSKTQKNLRRGKASFACLLCTYSSDWRSNLRMHAERVHKATIGVLECCGITYPDKKALRQHIAATHTWRFVCKVCGCSFTQPTSLRRHVTKQSCFKKFICSICDYATSRKDYWDHHSQLHKIEGNKHECSSTSSAPVDSPQQNSPLNVQLKESSFTCPNCPFETRWEHSLRRHKRTHYRITMESCWTNFSDKMNGRKRMVHNHRQKNGDLSFQCATCNKVFKSAYLLRRHQPVHSGQKPFKCNFCDYASSRLWNLNHHKALRHKEDNQPTALPLSSQPILPDNLPSEGGVEVQHVPLLRNSLTPVVDQMTLEPEHEQIVVDEHDLYDLKHEAMEPNKSPHSQQLSVSQSPSYPLIDSMEGGPDNLNPQTSLSYGNVEVIFGCLLGYVPLYCHLKNEAAFFSESLILSFCIIIVLNNRFDFITIGHDRIHTTRRRRKIQKNSTKEAGKFNCTVCPFNTKWLAALKGHLRTHTQQNLFSPTTASSASSSESPLNKSAVFTCLLCPYSTKWKNNLKMHVTRMHKKKRCKCTTCGRIFGNVFVLQSHQKNHLLVKKFNCTICNYASSQKGHMEKHMKTHKPKEDFQSTSLSIDQPAGCDTSLEVRRLRSSRVIAPEREENRLSRNDSIENGRRGVKRKRNSFDPIVVDVRTEEMVRGYEPKDQQLEESQSAEFSSSESARSVLPPKPRQSLRSCRLAVEPAARSPIKDSCGNVQPLPLSAIDSIYEEARLLRSQASLVQTVPSLLPLLLRLLELSSSAMNQLRAIQEVEVRSRTIECFEYVWNASKIAIIRWDHLKNAMNRDTLLNAIRYAFGTLPVFINIEKNEHLEMLESVVLLSFNTVKNWKQPSA